MSEHTHIPRHPCFYWHPTIPLWNILIVLLKQPILWTSEQSMFQITGLLQKKNFWIMKEDVFFREDLSLKWVDFHLNWIWRVWEEFGEFPVAVVQSRHWVSSSFTHTEWIIIIIDIDYVRHTSSSSSLTVMLTIFDILWTLFNVPRIWNTFSMLCLIFQKTSSVVILWMHLSWHCWKEVKKVLHWASRGSLSILEARKVTTASVSSGPVRVMST